MQNPNALDKIRESLGGFVGQEIRLRANKGRKQVFEVDGVLEQTYPKVFVVRFSERQIDRRISYSYADLLTEAVELTIGDMRIGRMAAVSG